AAARTPAEPTAITDRIEPLTPQPTPLQTSPRRASQARETATVPAPEAARLVPATTEAEARRVAERSIVGRAAEADREAASRAARAAVGARPRRIRRSRRRSRPRERRLRTVPTGRESRRAASSWVWPS